MSSAVEVLGQHQQEFGAAAHGAKSQGVMRRINPLGGLTVNGVAGAGLTDREAPALLGSRHDVGYGIAGCALNAGRDIADSAGLHPSVDRDLAPGLLRRAGSGGAGQDGHGERGGEEKAHGLSLSSEAASVCSRAEHPSPIDAGAEWMALRDCAAASMNAADGRGVRGARVTCRNALVRAGHRPAAAQTLAETMARLGVELQRQAIITAAAIVATLTACASPAPASTGQRCTWLASVTGRDAPVAAGVELLGPVLLTSGPGWSIRVIDKAGRRELESVWFVPASQVVGCRP